MVQGLPAFFSAALLSRTPKALTTLAKRFGVYTGTMSLFETN
jgi:hypothetical protein